ncbi:hypothetical protein [Echinococcus multilocularis]|uniref:Uncharacterized protein n=1 Tax=Echinococcus multilocularis TaxID=6211 RepID=A0A068Y2X3_ECHMU|nr:hypothetical protein [Echinococcus multilocularis]
MGVNVDVDVGAVEIGPEEQHHMIFSSLAYNLIYCTSLPLAANQQPSTLPRLIVSLWAYFDRLDVNVGLQAASCVRTLGVLLRRDQKCFSSYFSAGAANAYFTTIANTDKDWLAYGTG